MNNLFNVPNQPLLVYADLRRTHAQYLPGFERYQTRNWDGEGAVSIRPSTIKRARDLLIHLRLPACDAAPGIDGSIGLLWRTTSVYLYVDFKSNGKVHWFYQLSKSEPREKVAPPTWSVDQIKAALRPAIEALNKAVDTRLRPQQSNSVDSMLTVPSMRAFTP